MLRDQSSYSSWYFIEQASIGDINANVTIALTSSVLSGRGGVGTTAEPSGTTGGMFSRVIGASGFQLININNVPLSLRGYRLESKLLGRNALINSMIRHYTAAAISEAHKVSVQHEQDSHLPLKPAASDSQPDKGRSARQRHHTDRAAYCLLFDSSRPCHVHDFNSMLHPGCVQRCGCAHALIGRKQASLASCI